MFFFWLTQNMMNWAKVVVNGDGARTSIKMKICRFARQKFDV